jgi:hypothetical protein
MKCLSFVATGLVAIGLLTFLAGCPNKDQKTVEGPGGQKMTVTAPANTSIKEGETTSITVAVAREKFNDPVELKFSNLPAGVSIMENDLTIGKDNKEAKLTLKAAPDAKLVDDQPVTVTASSGTLKQDVTFKLTVKKGSGAGAGADTEKKLTLKAPGNTTIKQDDTAAITVHITRDKFNDPVELKFNNLPKGVTVMENDLTISKDAKEAKLTLKAAPDAEPVDDHKVTVHASGGGLQQDATFNVTVKKKG